MYHPIFYNDWKLITLGIICLTIIFSALIICIFHNKIPWIKKWFSIRRMVVIMFILAIIIGLSIASSNHFHIFNQLNDKDMWIEQLIYLMASVINWCVTIMFIGYMIILPFRYFLTIFMFTKFQNPKKKFIKVSLMYLFFGSLALLITSSEYGMKDSLLSYASEFSTHPLAFTWDNYPTLFYISNWLLISGFQIKGNYFAFIFLLCVIFIILIEYLIIKLLYLYNYKLLKKIVWICGNVSNKTNWLILITPVFTFTAMMTSLMVQTIATILRIILVFILMLSLCAVIYLITLSYSLFTKSLTFKKFNKEMFEATKIINKNPISEDVFNEIKKRQSFRGFNDFNKEQQAYNIFLTVIFPLVIAGYLGFSSGPLLNYNFPIYGHIYFWIMTFLIGYVLLFAYAFKYSDLVPMKIMLTNAIPYVRSGFNMGILNFFNVMINKLALYVTFATYLAIACKHDYHYKRIIKNKKMNNKNSYISKNK